MDQLGGRIRHITNELREYVETRLELTLVSVSDKVSELIGRSAQKLLGIAVLLLGCVFALTSLSIYLGDVLDNQALGYLLVSVPLMLCGLLVFFIGPRSVAKSIQRQIMKEVLLSLKEKEKNKITGHPKLPEQTSKEEETENGRI